MKDNTTFKNNVYDFIDERLNESWTKLIKIRNIKRNNISIENLLKN